MSPQLEQTLRAIRENCLSRNQSLPSGCYTDDEFLQVEEQKLFRQDWLCLGRVDEIPVSGDFFTCRLLNEPLLVVRGADNEVRVFANVCRHRAMPVASGTGNTNRFVCPYHAWSYDIKGELISAPLMQASEIRDCRLPQVRSECWDGFIFATLNDQAPPLCESLQGLDTVTGNYQMAAMHHIASFEEVWDCNWKSLTENFMDGYHLSVVHPESLRPLTPTHLCESLHHDDACTSYVANYAHAAPLRESHAPTLSDEEKRQSRLFCIYPALVASVSADTLVYLSLQPKGVDQVRVKWGISVYEEALSDEKKQQRIEKWQQINHEDHQILQGLQVGLHSAFYQGGVLAPVNLEGCVSHFHDYLISKLG